MDQSKEINISKSIAKGTIWSFFIRFTQTILGFIKLIIIGNLLSPEDLGLFGITILIISVLNTFFSMGIDRTIIQKENAKELINTAWTLSIIKGIIMYLILFLISPFIVQLFDYDDLIFIFLLTGLTILFDASKNISIVIFQKELNFKRQFIYLASGFVSDFTITLILLSVLGNIWAMVIGLVIGKFVNTIISYIMAPYRPHFNLNLKKCKEIINFSKWLMISHILVFLILQGDDLLVGIFLGVASLGFYQMAYKISNLPATEITAIFNNMSYPLYSKLQDNEEKLKNAFLKNHMLINFISIPIVGFVFYLSSDIIGLILDDRWQPIVILIQVLILWAFFRSIARSISTFFDAIGKPKINTLSQIFQIIVLYSLIFPFMNLWGVFGVALSVLISAVAIFYVRIIIFIKITNFGLLKFTKPILFQIIFTLLSLIPIFILKTTLYGLNPIILLFLNLFLFVLCYLILNFIANKYFNYLIFNLIKELITIIKN